MARPLQHQRFGLLFVAFPFVKDSSGTGKHDLRYRSVSAAEKPFDRHVLASPPRSAAARVVLRRESRADFDEVQAVKLAAFHNELADIARCPMRKANILAPGLRLIWPVMLQIFDDDCVTGWENAA